MDNFEKKTAEHSDLSPADLPLTAPSQTVRELTRVFRRQLLKTVAFSMAAVGVLAAASIAWFVANDRVHSGTSPISSGFELVKLATVGQRQQAEQQYLQLPEGTKYTPDGDSTAYYYTEGDTIALRLSSEETLEVSPGAGGKVEFYIIPTRDGSATVPLYVGLGGYGENAQHNVVPINDPVLNALLSGHILLFGSYAEGRYSDWLFRPSESGITHNTITVTLPADAKEGVPVPVAFYWIWPLRYENLEALAGASFCNEQTQNMTTLGTGYRYSRVFLADPGNSLTDGNTRSKAYDTADEYIGGNAQYLYLTVQTSATADAGGGVQP